MPTVAYSSDLRIRVINHFEKGNKQKLVCLMFTVSGSTVSRWYQEYKSQGRTRPKPRGGSKSKIYSNLLRNFVDTNSNKNFKEMSQFFKVSMEDIRQKLRQLGKRYKKRTPTWNFVLKNVQNLTKS